MELGPEPKYGKLQNHKLLPMERIESTVLIQSNSIHWEWFIRTTICKNKETQKLEVLLSMLRQWTEGLL